jgi:hypothetical protein
VIFRQRKTERKHVEQPSTKWAAKKGVVHRKMNGLGHADWPDQLLLRPLGVITGPRELWVEFKKPGKQATEKQQLNHKMLRSRGYQVAVIDNVTDFKSLLRKEWGILP